MTNSTKSRESVSRRVIMANVVLVVVAAILLALLSFFSPTPVPDSIVVAVGIFTGALVAGLSYHIWGRSLLLWSIVTGASALLASLGSIGVRLIVCLFGQGMGGGVILQCSANYQRAAGFENISSVVGGALILWIVVLVSGVGWHRSGGTGAA